MTEPPGEICFSLEEAHLMVVAFEDVIDVLSRLLQRRSVHVLDVVGPLAGANYQLGILESRLGWTGGTHAG